MSTRVVMAALGIAMGVATAPVAVADPVIPADPAPAPATEPLPVMEPLPAAEPPAESVSVSTEPEGVQHLPSPDNLPPGTTQTAPERRTLGYLRDIWNAVRTEDVTMGDAILLIAQRPLDSVPPGMTPQQTSVGAAPALPPAPPAP